MKKNILMVLIVACIALLSCEHKKEVIAYPPLNNCDTSNVRYSVEIKSILSNNCYSCHAAAVSVANGGNITLDSYSNLQQYANSGLLLNVILHTPGYDFMPKSGGKLSDCDIAAIRTWIRNNYPNN
jgi:hypothetical protein